MSSTKSKDLDNQVSLVGSEQKSSKDILNELFSTFNTSFDDAETDNDQRHKKKKSKKSKKSKKTSKKDRSDDDGDSSGGGEQEEEAETIPLKLKDFSSSKKEKHKEKHKSPNTNGKGKESSKDGSGGGKTKSKSKKRSRGNNEDEDEDVDQLIAKHRKNVKNKLFKGIVSNIGDIVVNNDALIKSKSRKREEDLKRAAGCPIEDVEDGEILDDIDKSSNSHSNKLYKEKTNKKKHSEKLSASQAYKLDIEERILLGIQPVESNKNHHHNSRHVYIDEEKHHSKSRPKSRSKSQVKSHSSSSSTDRRSSGEFRREERSHSSHSSSRKSSRDEEETPVRQAPPRGESPPVRPLTEREGQLASGRSYSYKDTGWQKQRDQYNYENNNNSRSRRDEYDANIYYDRETTRRSDRRSGFGFVNRSYYDDPVHGDRNNHYNDNRNNRERSRSPRSRSKSSRKSRSRSPPRWRRSRSRSSERRRRHPDDIIDKAKLLEIARKNAAKLMRRGVLPTDIFSRDQIVAIRAGGKNIDELTDYCKRLAKKDARGDAISDDSDGEQFINHPFHVKDRPLPQITLNIRNAIPIPVRTPQELAIEGAKLKTVFPVSSGTQHRIKELEWHPVDKEEEEKKAKAAEEANKSLVPLDGTKVGGPAATTATTTDQDKTNENKIEEANKILAIEAPPPPPAPVEKPITLDQPKPPDFDISDVIAIRLRAMRQLSENPTSDQAKKQLEDATQMMKKWADAKALEPKFLSQSELTQGPQAWAKRDQLINAKEVSSPMGLHLLQKMGWKPGEGLGKFKAGDVEPLSLEVKTDKKGLTSVLDYKKGPAMPLVYDLSGKHPISALMELTAKRKWGSPDFDLVFEHGPPHKKQFVYKVVVNGVEYQPCVAVNNKKLAKANAAAFCLQSLGLLPTAKAPESNETLHTVPPPLPAPPPPSSTPSSSGGNNNGRLSGFTPSHYLQTVQNALQPNQPPLPVPSPQVLMPPPPPPPPLKRFPS